MLTEAVHRRAGYLLELRRRMERTGRTDDPLWPAVCAAAEAVHTVWVRRHYRACGVSRPREAGGSDSAGASTGGSP